MYCIAVLAFTWHTELIDTEAAVVLMVVLLYPFTLVFGNVLVTGGQK